MDGHVPQEVVHVHIGLQVLSGGDMLQGGDYPAVVAVRGLGLRPRPDGGVAVQVVVGVVKVRPTAAHGEAAKAAGKVGEIKVLPVRHVDLRRRGLAAALPLVRPAAWTLSAAEVLRRAAKGGEVEAALPLAGRRHVLGKAADVHAVGLVELAALRPVVAQQEAVLHGLQGQVDAPVLTVDVDDGVVVQGGVRPQVLEHVVDEGLLHVVGGVGVAVVEDQLIQAVAGLALHVLVELQLEAVAVGGGVAGDGGEAGVALGAHPHPVEGLAVDLYVALVVFLGGGVGQHVLPVGLVHENVDGHGRVGVKELRGVLHRDAPAAQGLGQLPGKEHGGQAQPHGHGHNPGDDFGDVLMGDHADSLRYDRYSPL